MIQRTSKTTLSIVRGLGLIAGGLFAVVSLWTPSVFGTISTAEVGLSVFALGFVADAGWAFIEERLRRTGLSGIAAAGFLIIAFASPDLAIIGVAMLLLVGIVLLGDSFSQTLLRERLAG